MPRLPTCHKATAKQVFPPSMAHHIGPPHANHISCIFCEVHNDTHCIHQTNALPPFHEHCLLYNQVQNLPASSKFFLSHFVIKMHIKINDINIDILMG